MAAKGGVAVSVSESKDIRPVPDPTILTTQQLVREMALLRELMETRFTEAASVNALSVKILETRLESMDKAVELLQTSSDKIPSYVDEKLNSLKEIHEEKFNSVQTQFKERDTRTEQTSKDSKVAVDAALQAAKEAVGEQNKSSALAIAKSEASTVKQIDQLGLLIQQMTKAADDKFNDVKERLTRIEGKEQGVVKQVSETHRTAGDASANNTFTLLVIGLIGTALFVVAVAAVVITIMMSRAPAVP